MEFKPESLIPVDCKVWIRVDEADEMFGTLHKPEDSVEREQLAQDMGVLLAKGGMAFHDWVGRKPNVGDRVVFDKYKGRLFRFREEDRKQSQYRLVDYMDIGAIIEKEE